MIATIKANGYLVVYAESELESYALLRWGDANTIKVASNAPKIVIDTNFPEPTEDLKTQ